MSEKPVNAWDRLPNEGVKPYTAFQIYLNLGVDRSLPKVHAEYGKSASLISRWSANWKWAERAAAYDAEMRLVEMKARREMVAESASDDQLEKLRNDMLLRAELVSGISMTILHVVGKEALRYKRLQEESPKEPIEIPSVLGTLFRAATSGVQSANEIQSMALGVDDIIGGFTRGTGNFEEE
jgi:hypothetical protein